MKTGTHILLGVLIAVALPLFALALNTIVTGFQVASTQVTIDAHGVCQKVNSTDGKSYFVPTNTAAEWSAFRSNKPSGVSLTDCPPPCGGYPVGGFCWYFGEMGQSCTQVCSAHGGYNVATRDYAGSSGTNTNCRDVWRAAYPTLPDSYLPIASACSGTAAYGCFWYVGWGSGTYRCTSPATTESASYGNIIRACACNN